ncbi:TIGR03089 family protein [Arthrobacter psychrolactophilus]|uniref:TIGR03089 family protein n=1 Tax=Arthrobacter psychrolactophilus TaxID=92442 RepID=A0A2V5IRY4_9MICC|nr:TIGR03089 family protein [Arthrobacter psychrolactophilus]PYI38771.1 TIGR03089 family protein [Arthrobacter psychrolactophilus]
MELTPTTPAALLNAFRTQNPTSPRLSWYGPDSERVELSGRVLDNWIAKTANYLVDELDAEPGTLIALDLPLHWRSMVWLLASWAVGATVISTSAPESTTPDPFPSADIVATADPAAMNERLAEAKPAPLIIAVALPALQMRWLGELPPRTLDYSGDVRAHGDVFFADADPEPSDIAWQHDETTMTYDQVIAASAEAPQRVLLEAREGWAAVVRSAVETWAAGGSVVLLDPSVAATERLRSSENITA